MDSLLQNQEAPLSILKENLEMAQNHMKQQVDQHHSKHSFEEGGHVFHHLQPYKNTYLKGKGYQKFAHKF